MEESRRLLRARQHLHFEKLRYLSGGRSGDGSCLPSVGGGDVVLVDLSSKVGLVLELRSRLVKVELCQADFRAHQDNQLGASHRLRGRSEQSANQRQPIENRNAASQCALVILNQAAQHNRGSVRRRNGGTNVARRNDSEYHWYPLFEFHSRCRAFAGYRARLLSRELISGTTSSCKATFLNSILVCCEMPFPIVPP